MLTPCLQSTKDIKLSNALEGVVAQDDDERLWRKVLPLGMLEDGCCVAEDEREGAQIHFLEDEF